MKKERKWLALFLVFSMVLSLTPITARAEENGNNVVSAELGDSVEITVSLNETAELRVDDNAEGATYKWYKWNGAEEDTLVADEAGNSYTTPTITEKSTYYCELYFGKDRIGSAWFLVLIDGGLEAQADGDTEVVLGSGESTTLKVSASADDEENITYQWYKWEEDKDEEERKIAGATSSSYEAKEITQYTNYYCVVTDKYGNTQQVDFYISIDNEFTAEAEGDNNVTVSNGSTATLKVKASVKSGDVTYQWYTVDDELISNATEASYTTPAITKYTEYYCEVTDSYGNMETVWFNVSVDNGFTAEAEGSNNVTVSNGSTATLKVNASVTSGSIVSYQWYIGDGETIEGATGDSYTTPAITGYTEYYCEVMDSYGNMETVWFYVSVDNGFTAEAEGDNNVTVSNGSTATLKVKASVKSGDVTYQWYTGDDEPIEGATGDSYTTPAITEYTEYYCEVTDSYEKTETVWFYVSVDSGLTAKAKGEQGIKVSNNGSTTLEVIASVNDSVTNRDITYQWYREYYDVDKNGWYDEKIDGATTGSYTAENITWYTKYYCKVTDAYGNTESVFFEVFVDIDSGLTVKADGDANVTVTSGKTATLKVIASTTADVPVSYKWCKWVDEYESYTYIVGASSDSYTTPELKEDATYRCVVRDLYGNTTYVDFSVKVNDELPGDKTQDQPTGDTSKSDDNNNQQGNDTGNSNQQKDNNKLVTKLKLTGMSKKIAAGKKITLTPTFSPADATNQKLVWSTSNKKYATVSSNGVVTTKKAGAGKTVTITATTQDGSNIKATYKIKIVKHVVKSIKITAKSKSVKAGKKLSLKAKVKTSGKTANKTLKWSSSNEKYATVSSKGVVKTKKAGKGKTVKITAKATDGSGKKATFKIKIK